jgi:hypothetical protein
MWGISATMNSRSLTGTKTEATKHVQTAAAT